MITREQMKHIGYEHLIDDFIGDYIFECGQKKLNEIIAKVCESKKVLEFLGVLYNQKVAPTSQEILTRLYSIGYFMFAKAETLCLGSLILASTWHIEFNKKLNIISDDEFTELIVTIILDCDKRRTHIKENFFSRYFIKISKRLPNTNYLQKTVSLLLNSIFFDNYKNFEESTKVCEYQNELNKYREFKAILICANLYQLKFQERLEEVPKHIISKIINDTQRLILDFYQNYIIADRIILNYTGTDNTMYKQNGLLLIFQSEQHLDDIKSCLKTGDAFWFEKYENEEEFIDDDFSLQITGENHYYRFIMELLAVKIKLNYEDRPTINILSDSDAWGLDGYRMELINLFPAALREVYNAIEIKEEDFR